MVIGHWGTGTKGVLLAILAFDWAGGVVANASEPVRAWWRDRTNLRPYFYGLHVVELPVALWLADGEPSFGWLAALLTLKIVAFARGRTHPGF